MFAIISSRSTYYFYDCLGDGGTTGDLSVNKFVKPFHPFFNPSAVDYVKSLIPSPMVFLWSASSSGGTFFINSAILLSIVIFNDPDHIPIFCQIRCCSSSVARYTLLLRSCMKTCNERCKIDSNYMYPSPFLFLTSKLSRKAQHSQPSIQKLSKLPTLTPRVIFLKKCCNDSRTSGSLTDSRM